MGQEIGSCGVSRDSGSVFIVVVAVVAVVVVVVVVVVGILVV